MNFVNTLYESGKEIIVHKHLTGTVRRKNLGLWIF